MRDTKYKLGDIVELEDGSREEVIGICTEASFSNVIYDLTNDRWIEADEDY